jgi:hypothetical protein
VHFGTGLLAIPWYGVGRNEASAVASHHGEDHLEIKFEALPMGKHGSGGVRECDRYGLMRVQIAPHANLRPVPQTFYLGERRIEIIEVIDQWYGPEYRYVKVKGYDGSVYILGFDEIRDRWELIMFSSARAPRLSTGTA